MTMKFIWLGLSCLSVPSFFIIIIIIIIIVVVVVVIIIVTVINIIIIIFIIVIDGPLFSDPSFYIMRINGR